MPHVSQPKNGRNWARTWLKLVLRRPGEGTLEILVNTSRALKQRIFKNFLLYWLRRLRFNRVNSTAFKALQSLVLAMSLSRSHQMRLTRLKYIWKCLRNGTRTYSTKEKKTSRVQIHNSWDAASCDRHSKLGPCFLFLAISRGMAPYFYID